ncbi:MAG: hypothetical protein LUE26_05570 [Alistipes sp.]|nr:hypothetical protein [Alistipes sp.]
MSSVAVLIIAAAVAVGLFILGMSITLMVKGHHIRSEISDNPNLTGLGLKCAIQESIEEERALRGPDACMPDIACPGVSSGNCDTCGKE